MHKIKVAPIVFLLFVFSAISNLAIASPEAKALLNRFKAPVTDQARNDAFRDLKAFCAIEKNKADCTKMQAFFISKSKQADAKISLTSAFINEVSYYTENTKYFDDFADITSGIGAPQSTHNYVMGISPACTKKGKASNSFEISPSQTWPLAPDVASHKSELLDALKKYTPPKCDSNDFLIVAVGSIAEPFRLDVWTINKKKQLVNIIDGLLEPAL